MSYVHFGHSFANIAQASSFLHLGFAALYPKYNSKEVFVGTVVTARRVTGQNQAENILYTIEFPAQLGRPNPNPNPNHKRPACGV